MKITKAVIPAAGLGTRVLPATKSMPKEMLPIVDKPAIQYIVEEAVESGITDILIITNRGKGLIEDHFDRNWKLVSPAATVRRCWKMSLAFPVWPISILSAKKKPAAWVMLSTAPVPLWETSRLPSCMATM